MDIDQIVQEKIEADADFQATLSSMEETEREEALDAKKKEVLSQEFSSLSEKAQEADKLKKLADNYKIRAEKAEKGVKKEEEPKEEVSTISAYDQIALINAKVHEDDIERVEKFAKMEGVSIREALKDKELKAILDLRNEERTTADGANITNTRRQVGKVTGETLLENAKRGELPETDDEIEKLVAAKAKQR